MFVSCVTTVPIGLGDVQHRLESMKDNLEGWAEVAYREGEELRSKVGPGQGGFAKTVNLDIGMAEIHKAGLLYPVNWKAIGADALFPSLSGDLVLSHAGQHETNLSFEATYRPPLGPVGRLLDRALLRKLAEATVQNWFDRLAGALTAEEVS